MVSCWHSCTNISWEKPRELPHFIFFLSLKLHDSKLMLKLYYLHALTSLLIGCDTNVALDSGLSLGAWNLKLTTPDWKKQTVKLKKPSNWNFINKGLQSCSKMWAPDQWKVNKGKIQGPRRGRGCLPPPPPRPTFWKKKEKKYTFSNKRNLWQNKNIRLADLAEASKFMIGPFRESFDPISYGDPQNDYLYYKTQGHSATIFCKITVQKSK